LGDTLLSEVPPKPTTINPAEHAQPGILVDIPDPGTSALEVPETFAFTILKGLYVALPAINWALLAYGSRWGSMRATDTVGVVHYISLQETENFEYVFFYNSILCGFTLFGHFWVTTAQMAVENSLDLPFTLSGRSYSDRLAAVERQIRHFSGSEWGHRILFLVSWWTGALFVFTASAWDTRSRMGPFVLAAGFLMPLLYLFLARVVAASRPKVVREQREQLSAFAKTAVWASLVVFSLQAIYGTR
jgi:hypothetical protein